MGRCEGGEIAGAQWAPGWTTEYNFSSDKGREKRKFPLE